MSAEALWRDFRNTGFKCLTLYTLRAPVFTQVHENADTVH
jgi:hypothetical protein